MIARFPEGCQDCDSPSGSVRTVSPGGWCIVAVIAVDVV